jgi:hypothetical protein
MRKNNNLVYGIGTNSFNFPTRDGANHTREYIVWSEMLRRCTGKYWSKKPTYIGVTCSENFKSFEYFYEWCQNQVGFRNKDGNDKFWHLDKDILVKGNKVYSEDTCCFVPQSINSIFISAVSVRGNNPVGVCFDKNRNLFSVSCCCGRGTRKWLGRFSEQQDAFLVYKEYKQMYIKQVAEDYKHLIDERAYQALINYEVNEND